MRLNTPILRFPAVCEGPSSSKFWSTLVTKSQRSFWSHHLSSLCGFKLRPLQEALGHVSISPGTSQCIPLVLLCLAVRVLDLLSCPSSSAPRSAYPLSFCSFTFRRVTSGEQKALTPAFYLIHFSFIAVLLVPQSGSHSLTPGTIYHIVFFQEEFL